MEENNMFGIILVAAVVFIGMFIFWKISVYNRAKESCNRYASQAEFVGRYTDEFNWCMNNRDLWK